MRILRHIALVVDWLFGVALGFAALLWVYVSLFGGMSTAGVTVTQLTLHGWHLGLAVLIGCGLLILNLAVVFDLATTYLFPPYLRLQTAGARVSVSVRAIQGALKRAVLALEEVSGVRVRIHAPRKVGRAVVIEAYVTLESGVVYRDVSRSIINAMETKFGDIVGPGVPVECHVYWEKIKREDGKGGGAKASRYEVIRPQFPVEEEGQDVT